MVYYIFYVYNINHLIENFICEFIYFQKIEHFIESGYTIFSLGDSLYKFNLF